MANGIPTTAPYEMSNQANASDSAYNANVVSPQTFNMETNYANENKWFAMYPLEDVLGKKYKNLNLHLTKFSIPQLMQSSNTVSFRGYEKEIPGKVLMPSTKEVTLEYIVDADWQNYRSLYALISNINGTINPVSSDEATGITPAQYLPLRIYLLSPFKKKIIQFVFDNTWIKIFNELSLDANSPNEVHHSFTIVFDSYHIEDV